MTTLYGPQRERVLSIWTDVAEREERVLLGKIEARSRYHPSRSEAQTTKRLMEKREIEHIGNGWFRLTEAGLERARPVGVFA